MPSIFEKTQEAFGLDVGNSSIHVVQFSGDRKAMGVRAFGQVALPKGVVVSEEIADQKLFQALLGQTLDRPQYGRVSTRYAVVNVPESKSFVRVIQIPIMSESEAENAVPVESENFIPLPVDQVYLDWQILGTSGDKMNVLIVACPREFVDKYLDALEAAGIKVAALEVESQSVHRALVDDGSPESSIIADLSANHTSLIVVEDGNLQFTSTVPIAGNTFTETLARSLGVSSAKAELIKRKVGFSNTTEYPNVKTALLPILTNLLVEIKNIANFYHEHAAKTITQVTLTGGSAKLLGLTDFLSSELSGIGVKAVSVGDPWKNVPGLKSRPLDQMASLDFTTAIGLAMRGVRFSE